MPAKKPVSVTEEPITSFDQITPEFLAQKERVWEDVRIKELTLANLSNIGKQYHEYKSYYKAVEQECRWRAIRAINLDYDKKELAEAMGVSVQTITRWTRGKTK